MKHKNIIIMALCVAVGFALGLLFEGTVSKAYAKTENSTDVALTEETSFGSIATGMMNSADYEIVYIYGKKYIIFKSGGDIEVLEY